MTTPLPALREMTFPINFFPDLSYLKYSHEAIYLNEMQYYQHLYNLTTSLDNMGYEWNDRVFNPIILLAFGIGFRVAAFIAMVCVKPSSLFKLVYFSTQNFILEKFRKTVALVRAWRIKRQEPKGELSLLTTTDSSVVLNGDSVSQL